MKCATYISATITETETGCTIEFSNGNQIETPTWVEASNYLSENGFGTTVRVGEYGKWERK